MFKKFIVGRKRSLLEQVVSIQLDVFWFIKLLLIATKLTFTLKINMLYAYFTNKISSFTWRDIVSDIEK